MNAPQHLHRSSAMGSTVGHIPANSWASCLTCRNMRVITRTRMSGLQSAERRNRNVFRTVLRVDRIRWAYIFRELIPGGGTCYGELPSAEVGGCWTSDQVTAGGRAASDWRDCWHKSPKYVGLSLCSIFNVSRHSLNWTRYGTGKQWTGPAGHAWCGHAS